MCLLGQTGRERYATVREGHKRILFFSKEKQTYLGWIENVSIKWRCLKAPHSGRKKRVSSAERKTLEL